jgi:hypothetical protein
LILFALDMMAARVLPGRGQSHGDFACADSPFKGQHHAKRVLTALGIQPGAVLV